jgi:hypothetical protein
MSRDLLPDSCSFPSHSQRAKASKVVESDPGLTSAEQELTVRFASDREYAKVHSEIPSTVRRLLAHEHFGIESVRVSDGDSFGQSFSWEQWQTDGPSITGVQGYVPIGVLKIQQSPRSENYPALVVSDYDPDSTNGGDSP